MPEPKVETWLATQSPIDIYMTAVSEAELHYGAAIMPEGKWRDALIETIEGVLREYFHARIPPFDSPAAEACAAIAADGRSAGRAIGQLDCRIAAIGRARDAAVATRNAKDFEECGIEVIDPWNQG